MSVHQKQTPVKDLFAGHKTMMSLIILAIILIYASFSWLCPIMIDDYMFWGKYITANNGSTSPSLTGYLTYVRDLWLYENGRFANMLCAPVVLWMPKWIWAIILAVIICATYLLSAWMVNGSRSISPLLLMSVWICCILLLPWYDISSLMLIDYALNYFPPTLLTLASIWAAYHIESGRQFRHIYYCAIIVIAFLAGIFHEGFSMPLLAALSVIAATRRFSMPGQWWGVYIALLCGTIISAGSPAIWTRFFTTMDSNAELHLRPYLRALVKTTPMFFALSAAAIAAIPFAKSRRILRNIISDRLNQYLLLTASFAAIMVIILKAPVRATTGLNLLLIIFLLRGIKSLDIHISPKSSSMAAIASLIAVCLFYTGVLRWQFKIFDENRHITMLLEEGHRDETIYMDTIRHAPWWTLSHPVVDIWYTSGQIRFVNSIYGRPEDTPPVLPEILERYDFNNPVPIPGNTDFCRAGDIILMRGDNIDTDSLTYNWRFTLAGGEEIGSYVMFVPFIANNGERWIAGFPTRIQVKGPFLNITESY